MELSCVPYVLGRGGHFRRERKRLPGRADDARSGGWQLAHVGPGDCNAVRDILGACARPLLTGKADDHDLRFRPQAAVQPSHWKLPRDGVRSMTCPARFTER